MTLAEACALAQEIEATPEWAVRSVGRVQGGPFAFDQQWGVACVYVAAITTVRLVHSRRHWIRLRGRETPALPSEKESV